VSAKSTAATFVLVISGLARESSIVAGPGVWTVVGSGASIESRIESEIARGAAGVLSFGIAGGLDPALAAGTCILAGAVIGNSGHWTTDPAWQASLAARLPGAFSGHLAGVDSPALTPSEKRDLRRASGAVAVDMESHIAARAAAACRVPFAALRVICDPAERAVPSAALAGLRPDGRTHAWPVMLAVLAAPIQLPQLFRLAGDARRAFAELRRCRQALGARLALP
jgi:hopanoid-associated phosphorylase